MFPFANIVIISELANVVGEKVEKAVDGSE